MNNTKMERNIINSYKNSLYIHLKDLGLMVYSDNKKYLDEQLEKIKKDILKLNKQIKLIPEKLIEDKTEFLETASKEKIPNLKEALQNLSETIGDFENEIELLNTINYSLNINLRLLGIMIYRGEKSLENQIKKISKIEKKYDTHLKRVFSSKKDESLVPENYSYCYGTNRSDSCPYHFIAANALYQDDGICLLKEYKDSDGDGFSLIWDQIKECGINLGADYS